jgi:Protein of unknown function (DUF1573)
MGPLARGVAILSTCLVLSAVIGLGRSSSWFGSSQEQAKAEEERDWEARKTNLQSFADDRKDRERRQADEAEIKREEMRPPQIADKPPFPKAVVDADEVDAGAVSVGKTVTHRFTIKNVGQGPLVIREFQHRSRCGCAVTPKSQEIPPGGSTHVDLSYRAVESTPYFARTHTVWTNDPAHPQFVLKVFGKTADKPSLPKLNVDAGSFDFGTIQVGETVMHSFKLRNVGQGPLLLEEFRPDSHCGIGRILVRRQIPSGGTANIDITSKLREPNCCFAKTIHVSTNDPARPEFDLKVFGKVVARDQSPAPNQTSRASILVPPTNVDGKR